jgi:D-threo-aldose 1-dehydrogenase
MLHRAFGNTDLNIPPIVFGTSSLGNLYAEIGADVKLAIVRQWFCSVLQRPVVIDTAGKYGAGMALEELGRCLRTLDVDPAAVLISNKLGWKRKTLATAEPTFEPAVWKGLAHDAEQDVSYQGILDCWHEGCNLLGEAYSPQLVSVHDPDEYLAAARSPDDRSRRLEKVLSAYRALDELKGQGLVRAIGVGAKNWQVIREIDRLVPLDWVMFANSLTILRHPPELLAFVRDLAARGVGVINSAVFHAGFLVGGPFFDYEPLSPATSAGQALLTWRDRLHQLCRRHDVAPAAACVQFALTIPGVAAVALNSSDPARIAENVALTEQSLPPAFWTDARSEGLIEIQFS